MSGILNIETDVASGFGYVASAIYGVGHGNGYASLVTNDTLRFLQTMGIVNHDQRLIINSIFCEDGSDLKDAPKPLIAIVNNDPVLVKPDHIVWERTKNITDIGLNTTVPRGQLVINILAAFGFSKIDKPRLHVVLPIDYGDVYRD